MSAAPPFTVAVPSIGRMEYLPALRASITAQTMADFEVLVLDNESPDDAQAFFADWAREDARVRVLRAAPRIPMFSNFNRGYLEGRGEYFALFHDDDVYMPDFLARHRELFEREPRVGFSGSNNHFIDAHDHVFETRQQIDHTQVMPGRRFIEEVMSRARNIVWMQSTAYRRTALAPGIDDRLSPFWGDLVMMMRIAEKHDVGLIAEPLVKVRRHGEQFSVKGWKQSTALGHARAVLGEYATGYGARHPDERDFAHRLERLLARAVRKGAVWGWLSAADADDGAACLGALGGTPLDGGLAWTLRGLDRIGLDARLRRERLAPLVRRVGLALKL